MKFSENWLREQVDVPADRDTLVQRLTMAGLEVEAVTAMDDPLEGVVVARIVSTEPHPDADRLKLCRVGAGGESTVQIVCGAPNAREGLIAPLATVGAVLPGGMKIKPARLRGIESFGMLCSARELGLDADASGLMELPADATPGRPLAKYLGLPDAAIELSLTPNRPDCLGLLGLAHDVAALFGTSVHPFHSEVVEAQTATVRGVRLEAGADCPRYLGRVVEGIDPAAPTPLWMAERLRRAGLRPHSAVVDVTNYVMLELGQPLHAFDNARVCGDIVVRHAGAGETLKLLDGDTATLDPSFMVVADASRALAVAGVMGGDDSKVTDTTHEVFLEAAYFAPAAVMGRARTLGLHTDASHRFERGVDPALPRQALERATSLLLAVAGGRPGPVTAVERTADLPEPQPVRLRRGRLARVLGIEVADADVGRMLDALGMQVEVTAEGWQVTAPTRRFDIAREEDLIEEVARIHGYDRIPVHAPSGELNLRPQPEARIDRHALRAQAVARDYHEAICMAFVSAERLRTWTLSDATVALANPLSTDLAVMRPSLLPGLVDALVHNRARQQSRVRLFELGRSFHAAAEVGGAPLEIDRLGLVACGSVVEEQWGEVSRPLDFHDLKGDVESLLAMVAAPETWRFDSEALPPWLHPGRAARILRDDQVAGYAGALHPRLADALDLGTDVYVAELDVLAITAGHVPQARGVGRYPSVRRDLALEMDVAVRYADVARVVREVLGARLKTLRLFDLYAGEGLGDGRKSLAMGLILQDESRTLTDDDADRCVAEAIAALDRQGMARLRG